MSVILRECADMERRLSAEAYAKWQVKPDEDLAKERAEFRSRYWPGPRTPDWTPAEWAAAHETVEAMRTVERIAAARAEEKAFIHHIQMKGAS